MLTEQIFSVNLVLDLMESVVNQEPVKLTLSVGRGRRATDFAEKSDGSILQALYEYGTSVIVISGCLLAARDYAALLFNENSTLTML